MSEPRVYAYIVRKGRVAVFAHPDPDAGVQVPGGGVEAGESLEEAVLREVAEESGLPCEIVAYLGETRRRGWHPEGGAYDIERHYFHVVPAGPVAETWTWCEEHASDGGGPYELSYRWLPIAAAAEALDFGFGERLGALDGGDRDPGAGADDPAVIVGDGYERLATTYPVWSRAENPVNLRHRLIDRALDLGATGPALDIGCGTGELATVRLGAGGLDVVGVDLSPASITLAAESMPGGVFLAADITTLSLPLRHFGLVTAFNSVIHVPRERHAALYRDVRRWLRPGGIFVLNVETDGTSGAGTTERWIDDVEMYWSGWTADQEMALLEREGLAVVEVVARHTGPEPFTWLVCRRPG